MITHLITRIVVLVMLVSLVGSVMAARADNPAMVVSEANSAIHANGGDFSTYLPIVLFVHYCPDFFDDFSNPSSGWFVGEDNKLLAEYLDSEYRLLVKKTYSSYIIDAPTCGRQDYTVEVAARWADTQSTGISYGLMLGKMDNPSQLYLFEVAADTQKFSITHYGQGGWEYIIDSQSSSAIKAGAATNILMISHDGGSFTAMVNETELHTWVDATEPGEKGLGLIVLSRLDQGNADARFDDFHVTNISK